jgi:hypothetical protein
MRLLAVLRSSVVVGALAGLLYGVRLVPAPTVPLRDLAGWLARTPPEDALMAVARLLALVGLLVVLAASVLYALAVVGRAPAMARAVGHWTLPVVRRGLDAAVASTVVVGLLTTSSARASEPRTETASTTLAPPAYVPVAAGDMITAPVDNKPIGTPLIAPAVASSSPPPARVSTAAIRLYVVEHGDNLWAIAKTELTRINGVAPSDREVWPYWQDVIGHNRGRIRSGDPNLIHAGEVLELTAPRR